MTITRDVTPITPITVDRALTREEVNRIVMDVTNRLDAIYDILVALDARITRLGA